MCKKIGKYAWAANSEIEHDHPSAHGWSDETYDKHYRRVYDPEVMRKDRDLLFKRSKEMGFKVSFGTGALGDYPDVPECIDLRKRILPLGMKVLNAGVGPGTSLIAKQLPHLEFGRLDHIDIHEPYIFKAREIPWAAKEVRFMVGDITNGIDFSEYDLVLMADILEHLPKDDGLRILKNPAKKLLFVPLENEFRENKDGVESQEHKSKWTEQEFKDLGLKVEVLKGFHGGTVDAAWVTS
jgi:2-polyprenyl-3-methyl-5-hydroxy-6-metoxy-1,4-benzoquinol methylase